VERPAAGRRVLGTRSPAKADDPYVGKMKACLPLPPKAHLDEISHQKFSRRGNSEIALEMSDNTSLPTNNFLTLLIIIWEQQDIHNEYHVPEFFLPS
jgi:hypothetical protein